MLLQTPQDKGNFKNKAKSNMLDRVTILYDAL